MSGWRSWARSVGAMKDAWPPSIHQTTPAEPGSAAESRVTAHQAVSPAQRESLPTSPTSGQEVDRLKCCWSQETLHNIGYLF